MNMKKGLFLSLVILFLLQSLAGSDDKNQPTSIFTTRTEMVLVPVVVTDKSGVHSAGLTKDDFEVMENGKGRSIAAFEEIKSTTNRPTHAASARGTYSNVLSSDASPRRLTIFALDLINTPFMDQAYARQQLIKFLASRVSSQEPIALVAIKGNGITVLHDFTSDPAVLVQALKRVSGEIPALNGALVGDINAEVDTLNSFAGETGEYVALAERQAITVTLESFQHVAESFAGVPGRKSLIWATAAFPFALDPVSGTIVLPHVFSQGSTTIAGGGMDRTMSHSGEMAPLPDNTQVRVADDLKSLEPLYQRTLQMLSDANISVYPVDARGLMVFFPGANVSQIQGLGSLKQAIFEATRDTMVGFADMTGGKAFYNRNDLDVAFQKAADDSSTYYMLGYYLDKNAKPGWHKLKVKVRREGTEVRARNGFFVTDAKKVDNRKMDISLALVSPLDYTGLPLSVRWTSMEPAGAKKKIHFQITLPPSAKLADTANNNFVSLEFVAVARTPAGTAADQFSQHVETNLKPDSLQTLERDGLNYGNDVIVPPGEYSVRFVVRNNVDGRMGSVMASLRVTP
jgi:VWFA-related protein